MKIRLLVLLVLSGCSGCCFGQIFNPTAAGGSGTVTSVTGTANQIDVATGTTTPVLSLDAAILLPGTLNKLTITTPATGATLTIVDGKVFTVSNTLTLAGTDATTMTFPSTSATIARTDAANTFTGHQTIEGVTSTGATGTNLLVFATSPTLTTPVIGAATGTSLSVTGQLTSTVATGTAPLAVSSTTSVANLNAATVLGKTFPNPGPIGSTTPAAGTFTTVTSGTAGTTSGFVDLGAGYNTAAMTAQSTATCTNVTGMTWNIAANKRYIGACELPITLAASATVGFCLGGPGTATSYSLEADGPIGAAGAYAQVSTLAQTTYGTKTGSSSAVGAAEWVHVRFNVQNGSTASGTALTLQTFGNGTNNLTVGADASCTLTQQN